MAINYRQRAVAFCLKTEQGKGVLKDYAEHLAGAIAPSFALVAKLKARERNEEQQRIYEATQEERALFTEDFLAGYKGDAEKPKDVARVYWNRILAYALPKPEKGAKANTPRGYIQRRLEELAKLIKDHYNTEDELPDCADSVNAMLERAYAELGGDLAALKESF